LAVHGVKNNVAWTLLLQWAKSPKKQSEGVRICYFGTQNTVPCCQKYTLLQTAFSAILPTE